MSILHDLMGKTGWATLKSTNLTHGKSIQYLVEFSNQERFIMLETAQAAEQETKKARMVGINHVAIEVDDVEAALEFYGSIFDFTLRGRGEGMAFIDMGDQFIAIEEKRTQKPDQHRHFGLQDRGHRIGVSQDRGQAFILHLIGVTG